DALPIFFHNVLPAGVVAFSYYHLLPQTRAMTKSFAEPISPLGRALMPAIYPGLRWLLSTLLQLNPAHIGMVSSCAPIMVPDHYAKWLPPPEDLPPAFADMVAETRARPCAAFVN